MEVYALVGPSGTGKSYRALEIAYENDIDYIIDDGILIHDNKIIAGISAKQANTIIEAVKRAIFHDLNHREKVRSKIKSEEIEKILVIGTSKKMINQIIERLEIPKFEVLINIEDISSPEEINKAKESRKQGNHIIPVPTVQIKHISSGFNINPLKRLFKKNKKHNKIVEKTIIRPAFSCRGRVFVSPEVIYQIINYKISYIDGIEKVNNIQINNENDEISVFINLSINDASVIKECKNIQRKLKEEIEKITLINVVKIDIYIHKLKKLRNISC